MASNAVIKKEEKRTEVATQQQFRGSTTVYTPRCDIFESDDELIVCVDLPGVEPEDVDVRFERGELALFARCAPLQADVDYLGYEYGVGDYYRAFTIGDAIDADRIAAELRNGVLTVRLPKQEAVKPKRIAVKAD